MEEPLDGNAASGPAAAQGDQLPKILPRGFFLQDTAVFSSAVLTSSPTSPGLGPASSELQTGVGYAVDGGWMITRPLTIYSVLYSSSFITYQRSDGARDWNQYLNASIERRFSLRLKTSYAGRLVLTDDSQFLFGRSQSVPGDGVADRTALTQSGVMTPALNLNFAQRNLLVSSGAQLSYDYSPRTTLSLAIEAVRNQALGSRGDLVSNADFRSTSGSVTASVAYAISERKSVDFSLSSTESVSTLERSIFTSALSSFSHALTPEWFLKVQGGIDVEEDSRSRGSSTLKPIGGATLGYAKNSYQLSLSSTQGVVEIYGAGTGVVWSSNASWSYAPVRSRWSLTVNGSYDRTNAVEGKGIEGSRTGAQVRRALNRHVSISGQYAYLLNSYRSPLTRQGMNSQGVRLSLAWSPSPRGTR